MGKSGKRANGTPTKGFGPKHQPKSTAGARAAKQVSGDRIKRQYKLGTAYYQSGKLSEAEACFQQVLQWQPENPVLWYQLGAIAAQQKQYSTAIEQINRAIDLNPQEPSFHSALGAIYVQQQKWNEAIECYQKTIHLQPNEALAHANLGNASKLQGRLDEAVANYQRALQLQPDLYRVQASLGAILKEQGKLDEAIPYFQQTLQLQPEHLDAHNNLGHIYHSQGKLDEAIDCYQQALQLQPDSYPVHSNLGNVYQDRGKVEEAIACYQRSIQLQPNYHHAHNNLGNALKKQGKLEEAIASCQRAIQLQPDYYQAHNSLGTAYQQQGKLEKAIACYQQAIQLQPNFYPAHNNLGATYQKQGKLEEAIACHHRALQLQPDYHRAHVSLGGALKKQGKLEEAIACYHRALQLQPDCPAVLGEYICAKWNICSWDELAPKEQSFVVASQSEDWAEPPFPLLAIDDDPAIHLTAAQSFCANYIGSSFSPLWNGEQYAHDKIRLAYLSADYHEHPVANVMAELFERHDRSRFEVVAISFGPEDASPMRQRLIRAFDRFIDVREMSYLEAAQSIRDLEIDIAIDLTGYTGNCRAQILAHRPAPVQVNYLGYPTTMGADFIDYILVDPFVVPAEQQPYFTEKLVHLPDCYLGHDSTQAIADSTPSRAECGLPEHGFVFCSFNGLYKITPTLFDIWMRLLDAVPDSVLWLKQGKPGAEENLRKEAELRGVDPSRLVFAPRLDKLSDHLARQRLADLFLDCFPYNAHSTASDALWAGLPVLTCAGRSFASRVAGSLLQTIGLPELVTYSLKDYEALALKLAMQPNVLGEIQQKLARNRSNSPLFDRDRFRRNIEAAYQQMRSLWQEGEQPRAFAVTPPTETSQAVPEKTQSNPSPNGSAPQHQPEPAKGARASEQIASDRIKEQLELGVRHCHAGKLSEAEACLQQVLQWQPDRSHAWNLLGAIAGQQKQYPIAIEKISRAIELNPKVPNYYLNLGAVYAQQQRWAEAIECYQKASDLQPNNADTHYKLGAAFLAQRNSAEAIASCQRALQIQPNFYEAYASLGHAYKQQGELDEAITCYRRAIQLRPDCDRTHYNLGNALKQQGKFEAAIVCYQRTLQLQPEFHQAYNNLGTAYQAQGKFEAAIASYRRVIQLQPDFYQAHASLGNTFRQQGKFEAAIVCYQRALQLQPDCAEVLIEYVLARRGMFGWDGLSVQEQSLVAASQLEQWAAASPFAMLAVSDDPAVHLSAAQQFCANSIGISRSPLWNGERYAHDKIRLAYLSGDYREHPVARAIVELFERHDRSRFELVAISFGPEDASPMRQRLVRAFDRFIDVSQMSYREAAQSIRDLEIDIAVDLTGYTGNCRAQILSYRPAPIQVNYLGYPATMGTDFIDYILVDPFVVPAEQQPYFTEKLVHLPDCYLGHDSTQAIAERMLSRTEFGLPDDGFVFCSFNNSYKISPALFDVWMRLLGAVPGSVLWLKQGQSGAKANLRKEAEGRGIVPDRLVFAPRLDQLSDHLARHQLADLFLDCFPYNAHSTASDALWAGLPVLTCAGRSFASRVAGSLLQTIGLSELVTYTLEDYEALALKLATQPDVLWEIKRKLAQNRLSEPLFDRDRIRRNIEAAYTQMRSIWQRGEQPRAFAVTPSTETVRAVLETTSPIGPVEPGQRFVEIEGGVKVCVEDNLNSLTTYVLLEQGDWFEAEMAFIRRLIVPGMQVVDIGANHGVYTLTMAKLLQGQGQVTAYEPAHSVCKRLQQGVKANSLSTVEVVNAGLSDREGEATLFLSANSELNSLQQSSTHTERETIQLLTLDGELGRKDWWAIDFLKLDAEGEESKILAGGQEFFAKHSPLVMFELKHGRHINLSLIQQFQNLGYEPYSFVPGLTLLAPFDSTQPVDGYQLNLFACKEDRAQQLAERGLLVRELRKPPRPPQPSYWLKAIAELAYAKPFLSQWQHFSTNSNSDRQVYLEGLNGYLLARSEQIGPGEKLAALQHAFACLQQAVLAKATFARCCSLARVAMDLGQRQIAVQILQSLVRTLGSGKSIAIGEPFLPVHPQYDTQRFGDNLQDWLFVSIFETYENSRAFSSYFSVRETVSLLSQVVRKSFHSSQSERRLQLARNRQPVPVSQA
ncbi:FkbM family methyltransferase [Synechococcus sp. PCC 7336]|uniref:FkbM family methyltransferase n=1 Tax=Synechococcus sp. PCC 7336 TaxID=195250 RepID=UPI000347D1F0|nr:FkbM family methyltransferase [Synechococcus sp. PCC 7336]